MAGKFGQLIKNPFAVGGLLFLLNIGISFILNFALMAFKFKLTTIATVVSVMAAAQIVGGLSASQTKEAMPIRTKVTGAALYAVGLIALNTITMAIVGLFNGQVLLFAAGLNLLQAAGAYAFIGIGERSILRQHKK